jgi:hypothetical protein
MTRTTGVACLLAVLAAGCGRDAPPGYVVVDPIVDPAERTIAFAPFDAREPERLREGIALAALATERLRAEVGRERVIGPAEMKHLLRRDMRQADYVAVARKLGADLLVVGELTYFSQTHDKLFQSRQADIGMWFRILDVGSEGGPIDMSKLINWYFVFPESAGERMDPQYAGMDRASFRREALRFAATRVASVFFRHFRPRGSDRVKIPMATTGPRR